MIGFYEVRKRRTAEALLSRRYGRMAAVGSALLRVAAVAPQLPDEFARSSLLKRSSRQRATNHGLARMQVSKLGRAAIGAECEGFIERSAAHGGEFPLTDHASAIAYDTSSSGIQISSAHRSRIWYPHLSLFSFTQTCMSFPSSGAAFCLLFGTFPSTNSEVVGFEFGGKGNEPHVTPSDLICGIATVDRSASYIS